MAEALDVIAPRLLTPVQAALHPNVPAGAGLGRREDMSTGQPNRADALRRFVEYVLASDDAAFVRRVDVARFWIDTFG